MRITSAQNDLEGHRRLSPWCLLCRGLADHFQPRKSAIIAVCASILAAQKLANVPRNSPAYVAAIADAISDARRIVEQIERENRGAR